MPSPEATRVTAPRGTGVIHDIGYRHYDGERGGRRQILRALYVHSLRGVYGLGRTAKSKIMPVSLVVFMLLPAFILDAVMIVGKLTELPLPYTRYAIVVQVVPAIFLAAQAPQTVSRDLRFHSLPMYFSRPLTARDYVAAKYAGMVSALFLLLAAPLVMLYAGALLAKLPFWTQTRDFALALVAAALLSALLSGIGLLIASLTPRRGLGVAAIITFLVGTYTVVSAVQGITYGFDQKTISGWAGLASPMTLFDGAQVALFGVDPSSPAGPPGVAGKVVYVGLLLLVIVGGYALLSLRYKKVSHT